MNFTVRFAAMIIMMLVLVLPADFVFADHTGKVNRSHNWKQIKCNFKYNQLTFGNLKNMVKSDSFFDRREVNGGGIEKHNEPINDATVIRILNQVPYDLTKIVGIYRGVGDYNWPIGSILAKTLLQAIEETRATDFVVYWDEAEDEVIDKGFFATYYLKERVYFIKVVAFWNVGPQPDVCKGEYNHIP